MKDLLKLIANNNYIIVNRDLIKEIGLDETILLGELCSEQYYWSNHNKLGKDGFFYSTVENIENQIGIKKKKQLTLLNKLKTLNLVEVKYHDIPKKRYIRINVSELERIQEKYRDKEKNKIKLNEFDYEIIDKVFFENEFAKELRNTFAEYILVLKQEGFDVSLKNVRGLAKSLKEFEGCSIEEQKKIIKQSKSKKWKNFYPLKNKQEKMNKPYGIRTYDTKYKKL